MRYRWLLAAFPKSWRRRYGAELELLVEELAKQGRHLGLRDVLDLIAAGTSVRCGAVWRGLRQHSIVLVAGGAAGIGVLALGAVLVVMAGTASLTPGGQPSLRSPVRPPSTHRQLAAFSPQMVLAKALAGLNGVSRSAVKAVRSSTLEGEVARAHAAGTPISVPFVPSADVDVVVAAGNIDDPQLATARPRVFSWIAILVDPVNGRPFATVGSHVGSWPAFFTGLATQQGSIAVGSS